eukprot:828197-Alexandrium_andersonii.AAC.1
MPACWTTRSRRSGSRRAASAIPARWRSHAQADRCHCCWMMAGRLARAPATPKSHALSSCSSGTCA